MLKVYKLNLAVLVFFILWFCALIGVVLELVDVSEFGVFNILLCLAVASLFLLVLSLIKFWSLSQACKFLGIIPFCVTIAVLIYGYQPPIFTPTIVTIGGEEKVFVPTTLKEAHEELNKGLSKKTKKILRTDFNELSDRQKTFLDMVHFEFGMWVRNNWSLWEGGELSEMFNRAGINHPDNMYSIIIESYVAKLKGESFSIKEVAKLYAPTNSLDHAE